MFYEICDKLYKLFFYIHVTYFSEHNRGVCWSLLFYSYIGDISSLPKHGQLLCYSHRPIKDYELSLKFDSFFRFCSNKIFILIWYIINCKYFLTFLFLVVSNDPNPITRIISISSSDFPIRSWSVNFLPDPEGIYRKTNVIERLNITRLRTLQGFNFKISLTAILAAISFSFSFFLILSLSLSHKSSPLSVPMFVLLLPCDEEDW